MNIRKFMLAGLVCALSFPAMAGEIQCKGQDELLKTYLAMFDEVFNGRKLELIEKYTAPNFVSHDSPPGSPQGPEALRLFVASMAKSFPKRKLTNDLVICQNDLVVAYQTVEGTNDGPLFGGPPTGKSFNFKWIDIYRFKDGKVVERWGAGDSLGMMTQMGFTLTPPKPPAK